MPGVFISYAREDVAWSRRLEVHLEPFKHQEGLRVFSDQAIEAGKLFRDTILQAINTAQIAVLLVSADYLSSDFIRSVELPRIQERHLDGGTQVIPLLVQPCAWDEIPWLRDIEVRPRNAVPLAVRRHAGQQAELANVVREILAFVRILPVQIAR
ncbi:MAG TPA: toll/interleukin-1 receptor domain-containing protein [Thermoanaerobaculia bacterium]|jgi:hypothetical protein